MTFLQFQSFIKKFKRSEYDVNPAIMTIYRKALKEANKVIKDELGDLQPYQIKWKADSYE